MPDLIAQGPAALDRWRKTLPRDVNVTFTLGRTADGWAAPWDDRISRNHAELSWNGSTLEITRLIDSRNPIFHKGLRRDEFKIGIGEHFVIGQTTFSLVDQKIRMIAADGAPPAYTELTYAPGQLRKARFRDADQRIDVLSRLPEIISGSTSDEELCARVVNVLLQGIPRASLIALVADPRFAASYGGAQGAPNSSVAFVAQPHAGPASANDSAKRLFGEPTEAGIQLLHWDARSTMGQSFSPSTRLIEQALHSRESVLHLWRRPPSGPPTLAESPAFPRPAFEALDRSHDGPFESFTQSENIDWAFCTPIVSEACPGWAIYVAGDLSNLAAAKSLREGTASVEVDLQDDLKFAELTASTLSSLRQMRFLQRRQDSLRPFFAPIVQQALTGHNPDDALAPREVDVSVLFCDLRGFSRQSEESSDRLLELLQRVSDALGVMTHQILKRCGVVGDFHGDAAMGFWGWPLEDRENVLNAAKAALAIREEFEQAAAIPTHPLAGFRAGIGIATGKAVAGRIGTVDQVKVTVFGPVVNLASRLESMTKQIRAPILIDEETASRLARFELSEVGRVRRVAKVLPFGMTTPLVVSELLPPQHLDPVLTDIHLEIYESALDKLQQGDWDEAFGLLHKVPAEDRVKDFLTVFIAQHGRTPPANWQGIIELPEK